MILIKRLVLFIVFFQLVSCINQEETFEILLGEDTYFDISYGSHSSQTFDLYLPANRDTNTKTIILVHGGGWTSGDKTDMNYLIPLLKQNFPTYAIANMNYRLATSSQPAFPMQIDDIRSVVDFLKNNDYNISDNFGFIGTSAGGHLSLLYSYGYDATNNIKMVCSIVGPTNFTDTNYTSDATWQTTAAFITGVPYTGNEAYYQNLSPYHRASTTAPPTLLLYGNSDPLVPTTQGQDLHNKLNYLSVYNEFYLYNGGHGNWSQADLNDASNRIIQFISLRF